MRRIALLLAIAAAAAGCSVDLYESPDFETADIGRDVVLWRVVESSNGFFGIGGPITPEDLEEGGSPLAMGAYMSTDGRTWVEGPHLGTIVNAQLGLASWGDGLAASGRWDGTAAVVLSTTGSEWIRHDLPWDGPGEAQVESAGIAAKEGTVVIAGYTDDRPLQWVIEPGSTPELVEATPFPAGARLGHVVAGPAGFVAAAASVPAGDGTEEAESSLIFLSPDGRNWSAVPDPFRGDTTVTGLIGSESGYVAVVRVGDDDERFRLWTSADGISWIDRADQDSVFALLAGKGGSLFEDLAGTPVTEPQARPVAFSFNGRWLEITEAVGGERFVAVSVVGTAEVRLVSGFIGTRTPTPVLLIAAG